MFTICKNKVTEIKLSFYGQFKFVVFTIFVKLKSTIILDALIDIDVAFFLFLNGINSPIFDVVFYWVTSKIFWVPFYLYLVFLIAKHWGWKTLIIGLFIGLIFFLGDRISVIFFKDVFERLRPCHNPEISSMVHIVDNHCGGQYGFVSSHATNSFSLAVFSGLLFKRYYKYFPFFIILWATLVSYSRIYLGVHYPADIIGGALLGSVIGYSTFLLMKWMNVKFNFKLTL